MTDAVIAACTGASSGEASRTSASLWEPAARQDTQALPGRQACTFSLRYVQTQGSENARYSERHGAPRGDGLHKGPFTAAVPASVASHTLRPRTGVTRETC